MGWKKLVLASVAGGALALGALPGEAAAQDPDALRNTGSRKERRSGHGVPRRLRGTLCTLIRTLPDRSPPP